MCIWTWTWTLHEHVLEQVHEHAHARAHEHLHKQVHNMYMNITLNMDKNIYINIYMFMYIIKFIFQVYGYVFICSRMWLLTYVHTTVEKQRNSVFEILDMEYHGPVNFLLSECREILRNLQLIPTEVRKYKSENSGGIPCRRNFVDALLPGSKWGL
jgi:hypothetical protein